MIKNKRSHIEHVKELSDIESSICSAKFKGKTYRIFVYPDLRPKNWAEYFIIFDAMFIWEARRIARISFREARYIFTNLKNYKENWILNRDEKRMMVSMLQERSYSSTSAWEYAIERFNIELAGYDGRWPFNDAGKLFYPDGRMKFPKALPYDLPMPDYMQLPERNY